MKHIDINQNEVTDISQIGLSAKVIVRLESSKDKKSKEENASGTGYLSDDDEGRDEEFQNQ
jgi:hypothetical protein